jgi:peptide/nickel transport system ATP-binding protein
MIASAICCRPELLIADEPTTALDVTVQAQILALIRELQRAERMSVLFITHDLGIVAAIADRVAVMERGRIVEEGRADTVLARPAQPYTRLLIDSLPGGSRFPKRIAASSAVASSDAAPVPLLSVRGLVKRYRTSNPLGLRRRSMTALAGIDLDVRRGEVVAVVGESGSGKTTLGRCVLRLLDPSEGNILFEGEDVATMRGSRLAALRRRMQVVFQDPFASLNPQRTIRSIIGEGMLVHGLARRADLGARVAELLSLVGLDPAAMKRKPHAFSGGQRQRIAIARALALEPTLIIADEAVSALDATIRAQILALLRDIQARLALTVLFISHDLGVVRHFADRVAVLYLGRIVEEGRVDTVLSRPAHPYTAALLASEPDLSRPGEPPPLMAQGEIPNLDELSAGCAFRTRCPRARPECGANAPPLAPVDHHRRVACFFPLGM